MPLHYSSTARHQIAMLTESLPHAVLLDGISGIGLLSAATMIAGKNLAGLIQPMDSDGNVDLGPRGVIRVPQVRALTVQTRDKLTTRRVYIIDESDKMNHQAQSAFLKSLEEPVPHVHFILTSHSPHKLLPTILSRVQRIRLQPISHDETKRFIAHLTLPETITPTQLQFIADERPAEIMRLIQQKDVLADRIQEMSDARTFLSSNNETKIIILMKYASDRTKCLQFLGGIQQMVQFSILKHPSPTLIGLADRLADAYDAIIANSTIRLQLMRLVL